MPIEGFSVGARVRVVGSDRMGAELVGRLGTVAPDDELATHYKQVTVDLDEPDAHGRRKWFYPDELTVLRDGSEET